MASAFWGGVADYGAKQIDDSITRKRDDKQWEDRQKKAAELDRQRIASIQYGAGPDGKLQAQPVNSAGEPVGPPRPANQVEQANYDAGQTERTLKHGQIKAETEAASARTREANANIDNIPEEMKIKRQQADSYRTQASGTAAQASAYAEQARAGTARQNLETKMLEEWYAKNPGSAPPGEASQAAPKPLSQKEQLELAKMVTQAKTQGWDQAAIDAAQGDLQKLLYMSENPPTEVAPTEQAQGSGIEALLGRFRGN